MVAITGQKLIDEINRQLALSRSIAADQAAISSGKKLSAPSDDPQSWVEISDIGRQQANNSAWQSNITFAKARSAKAESNLNDINNQLTRARELMIQAASSTQSGTGRDAIVQELQGIRANITNLLNEKDYRGTPVFDDTTSTTIPVGRGMTLDVVGTRQSVSDGIDIGGTPKSIDDILSDAVTAITNNDAAGTSAAVDNVNTGLDHVIVVQSLQGLRGQRIDDAKTQLDNGGLALSERRSTLEDTDLTQTISSMQSKLLTLEAAQSAFARINQQTLFDLLR